MIRCVSFVIPAWNEAALIGQTIDSIRRAMQRAAPRQEYEIIVVDDDSSDATAEVAWLRGATAISVHKRNIAAVRNAGAGQSRGDVLIFVDADTRVNPALIGECLAALQRGATWGTAMLVPSDPCPLWARAALAAYNCFHVRLRKCAYGSFFFVTKSVFEQAGGFSEQSREGEDMALSKQLARLHGRPTVLLTRVATSARKAAQFGFWYHAKMAWLTLRYGDQAWSRPEVSDYRDGELRAPRSP